ncbi:TPA: hypothetical protein DIV49_00095 [Candidatus Saccharibacteria bacterium]|nr:hypothetical protein [Candidatus Saccharibacteria bacterium]HRJ91345.1 hypothetical protein [Candidatus Saccharibacteria bacterium]
MKLLKANIVSGILVSAGVLLGFGASTTFANRPPYHTGDGTITVCKSDQDGSLRVVPRNAYCKHRESKIHWSGVQTAIVHIVEDQEAEGFPLSYDTQGSRNVLAVKKIVTDGIDFSSDGFCVELGFTPLYTSDSGVALILNNLHQNENLEGVCGQGTDYEAFIDGRIAGSWFFSE